MMKWILHPEAPSIKSDWDRLEKPSRATSRSRMVISDASKGKLAHHVAHHVAHPEGRFQPAHGTHAAMDFELPLEGRVGSIVRPHTPKLGLSGPGGSIAYVDRSGFRSTPA